VPFRSKAQQRFMFSQHPDIARRWAADYGVPKNLPERKGSVAVLNARQRRRSATIKPSAGYPSGRFPMPDLRHARLALQMLPKAKGLSSGEEAAIRARANAKLRGTQATTAGRQAAAARAGNWGRK
jgi:hypothetical protein